MKESNERISDADAHKPLEAPEEETLTLEDVTTDEETPEERAAAIARDEAEKQRRGHLGEDQTQDPA